MDFDKLVAILFAVCFCVFVLTAGSCTYNSGVDYNQCVVNAPKENAEFCKVTR